jgi:hypothetical protein
VVSRIRFKPPCDTSQMVRNSDLEPAINRAPERASSLRRF